MPGAPEGKERGVQMGRSHHRATTEVLEIEDPLREQVLLFVLLWKIGFSSHNIHILIMVPLSPLLPSQSRRASNGLWLDKTKPEWRKHRHKGQRSQGSCKTTTRSCACLCEFLRAVTMVTQRALFLAVLIPCGSPTPFVSSFSWFPDTEGRTETSFPRAEHKGLAAQPALKPQHFYQAVILRFWLKIRRVFFNYCSHPFLRCWLNSS